MQKLQDPLEFFGVDALQDPYPLYDRLRAEGPVHRIGESGFYAVCSWEAINNAINRPADFSSNLTATMTFTAEGTVVPFEMDELGGPTQVLATADDPAHAAHRKMLVPQLAGKRIRAMEPFIGDTFDRLWTDGLRDGHIEWMGVLANRLPMMVVARLIGVPAADVDQLVGWAYASTQLLDGLVDQDQLAAAGVAATELANYILDHFGRAAADPRDDLLGTLATACSTGGFDEVTAQMMMIILFGAGGESTGSLLGNSMWVLATRPDLNNNCATPPTCSCRSSRRRCGTNRPSVATIDTSSPTPRWAAWTCPPAHGCCCCGGRRTGIRPNSTRRTTSGWIGPAVRGTSPLARERTSASAPRLRAWRLRSFCARCSTARPESKRSISGHGWPAFSFAAANICNWR